ncbi:hypothetical protein [Lysobacter sp. D1-1-M9]|uniref:hypothetical protein n=1 Tax=Novilysobacter longmucuonensis TaxID=3098603 RepID=UPI002FC5D3E0
MPSTGLRPFRLQVRLHVRALGLAALFACASVAFAQDAPTNRIEQQMSPEQFRAAGLDQLDAEQLANLNAWLNRTLDTETAKAAETAKSRVEQEHRGFLSFGSNEPIVARLPGEFRGFGKNRRYTLDNGQVWQQTDAATLAGARLDDPQITITPSVIGNAWYMAVEGYNTRAKVKRIK